MSNHTKGNWKWKQDRGNNIYEYSVFIADSAGDKIIAKLDGWTMRSSPVEEIKANARLIAASPDLLEACKAAYNEVKLMKTRKLDVLPMIEKAIAKAK
jgi:hypothetical protein